MGGFPRGTPDGPPVVSTLHGTLHIVAGGIGFLALTIATSCWLAASAGKVGLGRAVGSIVTGVAFLTAFAAIASGATAPAINLAFTAAVLLPWAGRPGDRTDAVVA